MAVRGGAPVLNVVRALARLGFRGVRALRWAVTFVASTHFVFLRGNLVWYLALWWVVPPSLRVGARVLCRGSPGGAPPN